MPMRTRTKSWVCRCWVMLRSPLLPARPPPTFTRTTRRAAGRARRGRRSAAPGRRSRGAAPGQPHGLTALVHVRQREGQDDPVAGDASTRRPARCRGRTCSVVAGALDQQCRSLLADVVARAGVLLARDCRARRRAQSIRPIGASGVARAQARTASLTPASRRLRRRRLGSRFALGFAASAARRLLRPRRARGQHGDDRHVGVAEGGDTLGHREVGRGG